MEIVNELCIYLAMILVSYGAGEMLDGSFIIHPGELMLVDQNPEMLDTIYK